MGATSAVAAASFFFFFGLFLRRFFLFCASSSSSALRFSPTLVASRRMKQETKNPFVSSSPGMHRMSDAASPVGSFISNLLDDVSLRTYQRCQAPPEVLAVAT